MVKLFIKLSQFLFKMITELVFWVKKEKGKKRKESRNEEEKKHELEEGRSKGDMKTVANSS